MEKNAKIYVAGHKGLAGSAILRRLQSEGYTHLITRTHEQLDLMRQAEVEAFSKKRGRNMSFSLRLRWVAYGQTIPILPNLHIKTS